MRDQSDLAAFSSLQHAESTATLGSWMPRWLPPARRSEVEDGDWFCYKGYKSYQPLNTWWAEQEIILHTEFRDGNVPAGFEQLRVIVEQRELPGMEQQLSLPFPTMELKGKKYKVYGIVTNMDWDGEELIDWYHKRCGKSEQAHAVMKDDLAGGKLPSADFGENAAW